MLQPASRRETTWTLGEIKDKETVAKLFYDTLEEIKDKETVAEFLENKLKDLNKDEATFKSPASAKKSKAFVE